MGQGNFKVDDYNTVAERIIEFREKYPDGSLQPADLSKPYELTNVGNNAAFVVVAAAYRTPDDPRPGIGMAYEPVPGTTPFTRGSELQNAETAAWGRAIVAVLAADTKKGIASQEEVRNRREEQAAEPGPTRTIQRQPVDVDGINAKINACSSVDELKALWEQMKADGAPDQALALVSAAGKARAA